MRYWDKQTVIDNVKQAQGVLFGAVKHFGWSTEPIITREVKWGNKRKAWLFYVPGSAEELALLDINQIVQATDLK